MGNIKYKVKVMLKSFDGFEVSYVKTYKHKEDARRVFNDFANEYNCTVNKSGDFAESDSCCVVINEVE